MSYGRTSYAKAVTGPDNGPEIASVFADRVLPAFNLGDIPVTTSIVSSQSSETQASTSGTVDETGMTGMEAPRLLTGEERFAFWQGMYGKTVTVQTPNGPKDMTVEPIFTPENLGPTYKGETFQFEAWMNWLYRDEQEAGHNPNQPALLVQEASFAPDAAPVAPTAPNAQATPAPQAGWPMAPAFTPAGF